MGRFHPPPSNLPLPNAGVHGVVDHQAMQNYRSRPLNLLGSKVIPSFALSFRCRESPSGSALHVVHKFMAGGGVRKHSDPRPEYQLDAYKWPAVRYRWNRLRPGSASVTLRGSIQGKRRSNWPIGTVGEIQARIRWRLYVVERIGNQVEQLAAETGIGGQCHRPHSRYCDNTWTPWFST